MARLTKLVGGAVVMLWSVQSFGQAPPSAAPEKKPAADATQKPKDAEAPSKEAEKPKEEAKSKSDAEDTEAKPSEEAPADQTEAPASVPPEPPPPPEPPAEVSTPELQPLPPEAPTQQAEPMAPPPADTLPADTLPPPELPPLEEPTEPAESPVTLSLFADANYAYSTTRTGQPHPAHRAYATNSAAGAYNGFSLAWLGLDASYDQGDFGATGSLRFGSAVPVYFGDEGGLGIDNLTQAYVTWRPVPQLTLDAGQFGTIYGAEVAESWQNLNYTRGGLYYAMQPFWHTGLRASVNPTDNFGVTALIVNGVNSLIDDNDKPSLGLQLAYALEGFEVYAGYFGTLEPSTDGEDLNTTLIQSVGGANADGFDHFFDLVAVVESGAFSLVLNGDYNVTDSDPGTAFYGVSLAAGYAFNQQFGIAARYEFLGDPDGVLYGAEKSKVHTVTGTMDIKPVKDSDNFILRWDNRFEKSNEEIFHSKDGRTKDTWFASVVGVVVTTDG